MQPTPPEARRIVATLGGFWLLGGSSAAFIGSVPAVAAPLVVVAIALGFGFYWSVYTVGARETGRSPASYFFIVPFAEGWLELTGESYRILFRILDPTWWHRKVIPATGWQRALTELALVSALVFALGSVLVLMATAPT